MDKEKITKIAVERIKENMCKSGITLQQIIDVGDGQLENLAKAARVSVKKLKKLLA